MKNLCILICLVFLLNGCVSANVPLDKYGYSNINVGANGNISGGVSGTANNTNVRTNF